MTSEKGKLVEQFDAALESFYTAQNEERVADLRDLARHVWDVRKAMISSELFSPDEIAVMTNEQASTVSTVTTLLTPPSEKAKKFYEELRLLNQAPK